MRKICRGIGFGLVTSIFKGVKTPLPSSENDVTSVWKMETMLIKETRL
jgi:hypothetical protein